MIDWTYTTYIGAFVLFSLWSWACAEMGFREGQAFGHQVGLNEGKRAMLNLTRAAVKDAARLERELTLIKGGMTNG